MKTLFLADSLVLVSCGGKVDPVVPVPQPKTFLVEVNGVTVEGVIKPVFTLTSKEAKIAVAGVLNKK